LYSSFYFFNESLTLSVVCVVSIQQHIQFNWRKLSLLRKAYGEKSRQAMPMLYGSNLKNPEQLFFLFI